MGARILVVDDNPPSVELIRYLLSKAGHELLDAEDGRDGIVAARRERPDLILMDVRMPNQEGFETIQILKGDGDLSSIPCVAVTAFAMVGDKEKMLANGFDGYMAKPIAPASFVEEVDAYLPVELRSPPSARPATPAARRAGAATATQTRPPAQLRRVVAPHGIRAAILVVDDRADNLEFLRVVLSAAGHHPVFATSARAAFTLAQETPPDLVLSDVDMPDGSGYELMEWMRSDPTLRDVPVVLISSVVWAERGRALAHGAAGFIERPIGPEGLLAELEVVLVSSRGR
jgi:two-component system, cell cycle response regulator